MTKTTGATAERPGLRASYPLLIDGVFREGEDGRTTEVVSPRDGAVITRVVEPTAGDISQAVAAARRAADGSWRWSNPRDRARLLLDWAALISAHADELALLEAIDTGKPIKHVRTNDLPVALESLAFFAAQTRDATGLTFPLADADAIHHPLADPVGVVVELLPWNGPIWTGVQRVAGAIATGNAVIAKPSELGAVVFVRLVELLIEAGLPAGVVNIVYGGPEVGETLVTDPRVDLISLTGGTRTGSRVLELAARSIKKVSLELGGKNPFVVLGDADVALAAMWANLGAFANAGQICISASRFLVEEKVYDEFVDLFQANAAKLRVGDPLDDESDVGTVISADAAERIWTVIDEASGVSTLVSGGVRYKDELRSAGAFVPPTIFADVPRNASVVNEEVFGPVAAIYPVKDVADAIAMANESRYGLSAGVFTRDLDNAWSLARGIRAGEIYVNRWFSPGVLEAPVEGFKQSGVGRAGISKYLQPKNVFFSHNLSALTN